ncbi:hypothetical protein JK359_12590 [Streptomyces actinomycinicus]|uniref:Uncharacterized protein n=1 Tax=Streptomyces actinomycinicus TaxID=1695166 RepID=A0A937JKR4_9ACTN|nr:DUF6214 family protein [Streptomyces actinomycinicus]MBL1082809.1 hypothetical protein [Streptomyces actinomycinicus]
MCSAWEVQEQGGTTSWFQVRLAFPDGARLDALAVVNEGCVSIEDVQAQPALSLADLTVLADWLEGPLFEACGAAVREDGACEAEGGSCETEGGAGLMEGGAGLMEGGACRTEDGCPPAGHDADPDAWGQGPRRARPAWPRGIEGRRRVAQEYRTAQQDGTDPVLAVMSATGHSRRRSLRLIAQARDSGYLTPRHARR